MVDEVHHAIAKPKDANRQERQGKKSGSHIREEGTKLAVNLTEHQVRAQEDARDLHAHGTAGQFGIDCQVQDQDPGQKEAYVVKQCVDAGLPLQEPENDLIQDISGKHLPQLAAEQILQNIILLWRLRHEGRKRRGVALRFFIQ